MRKTVSLAIALVALAVGIMSPKQADAGLVLYAQQAGVNSGNVTQVATAADFTAGQFTGTYGTFNLTIFGAASDNDPILSSLLTANVSLENTSTSTQTISLFASQNNYTLPVGDPLRVESGLSGTVNEGTLGGTGVFQAYLDSMNLLLAGDFTNGPQNVTFNGSTFDTGSAFGVFNRTNANSLYSITSQVTATVSGGGEGNFSSHINVSAVPEPGTLALALAGLPLLGFVAWRQRKSAEGLNS